MLALVAAAAAELGRRPRVRGDIGWADSGIFAEAGIPCAQFGPIGEGEHTSGEWVDVASVRARGARARSRRPALLWLTGSATGDHMIRAVTLDFWNTLMDDFHPPARDELRAARLREIVAPYGRLPDIGPSSAASPRPGGTSTASGTRSSARRRPPSRPP